MKAGLIFVLALMLVATSSVHADDNPETPWPIVERCVPGPTQPPIEWSYPGTLLMSGYAGIHAMRADWETPRIVASFYKSQLGKPIDGGQLSPNQRWYAVPIGEIFTEVSFNRYWFASGVRVYSMVDDSVIEIDFSDYWRTLDYGFSFSAWLYMTVRWIDDSTFVVGPFHVQPFELSVEQALVTAMSSRSWEFEVAPDWTRVYGKLGLYDLAEPNELIEEIETQGIAWRFDSSGFIGKQRLDSTEQLSLFTRDGEFVEQIHVSDEGVLDILHPAAGRNDLGWSPDTLRFAFVYRPLFPKVAQLMVLDTVNRIVINTCLSPVSQPVWSPDGSQIAILVQGRENLRVIIVDMDKWVAYDVARHSGISGALRPDMIVWRTND